MIQTREPLLYDSIKTVLEGEIWEKLEVCSVTSVIQTREPLLYDSIKILLVNEIIVEIEVC